MVDLEKKNILFLEWNSRQGDHVNKHKVFKNSVLNFFYKIHTQKPFESRINCEVEI